MTMSNIKPETIDYFNRVTGTLETEKVYGEGLVKFFYKNALGKYLAPLISNRTISQLYGFTQNLEYSGRKVPKFIQNFNISINDYLPGSKVANNIENSYKSFNEFFIRKFVDGKRPFVSESNKLGAFAEARYVGAAKVNPEMKFPVKGSYLTARDLIGNSHDAAAFTNGPLLIARLCPVDYHRYHYPDNGINLKSFSIHGDYHSVNPMALQLKNDIFIKNERRVSILQTENFGKLAYIEVGAICVGKIVQSHNELKPFQKGDEKGYFLFGGSTVVVLGEEGQWKPSDDIIQNTNKGIETYLQLGSEVGFKI
jgi:phosphatidylserine decarboxylase